MRAALRLVGLAGATVFGLLLALTYSSPIHVERAARGFVQSQIERQIASELGPLRAAGGAEMLAERYGRENGALRAWVEQDVSAKVAETVGRMQDLNCECRERLRNSLDGMVGARLSSLERAEPRLRQVIEGKYSEIVANLLRDLRIFLGTHLLAFLLLPILSFARPAHLRHLAVPGVLLAVAAVAGSVLYLFGQNWFFTLLHGSFMGWTYALWLLLIFGLFSDIVLFRARITSRILDVVGAATRAAAPC